MALRKVLLPFVILAACLIPASPAFAGEAQELTAGCICTSNAEEKNFALMLDGNYTTYYSLPEGDGWLEIESAVPICGVSVSVLDPDGTPASYDFQVQSEDRKWTTAAKNRYLTDWFVPDAPVMKFRIAGNGPGQVHVSEIRVFGEGDKPSDVQDWQEQDDCDLMLISCHPDDEVLWFAGFLPTYAGERNYRVQVVEMTTPTDPEPERPLELLACLWHCGVRCYPHFLGLRDIQGGSLKKQYRIWESKDNVMRLVTEAIRKYKPEVILTHGVEGEYGHSAHRVTSAAARACVKYAAKKKKYPESAEKYGTWRVKKLYLHEYGKNQIVMDWDQPLSAFGGKTGYQVAEEAYRFHASQIARGWTFSQGREHDNTLFGLYYSAVGEDTEKNDFMEHISVEN